MTEKEFNELVKEYQQGLKDLEEIREENSKRRSKMTEEEFVSLRRRTIESLKQRSSQ